MLDIRTDLYDKVRSYLRDELLSKNDSELKESVLYALIQTGKAEAIIEFLPSMQRISTYYPQASEVAKGLQTLHLQVRDRLVQSQ